MTREFAHELLNAAKAGIDVPRHQITQALYATGDLGSFRKPDRMPVQASHHWPGYAIPEANHASRAEIRAGELAA